MNLCDIIGPIMVGPSSSHTAGAVRIGRMARKILGCEPKSAKIYLHGSFAETGYGHGTDKALIAGLLDMETDDMRIPQSFEIAAANNLDFSFFKINLPEAHPNTVLIKLADCDANEIAIQASSIGGGRITINKIDDIHVNFSGEYNTIIVKNLDHPGIISDISSALSAYRINIASMSVYRNKKGGTAIMVVETDNAVPKALINFFRAIVCVESVAYCSKED